MTNKGKIRPITRPSIASMEVIFRPRLSIQYRAACVPSGAKGDLLRKAFEAGSHRIRGQRRPT
jgi:hypothetical protein